ncbi:MAG: methylated-DNA--[protein]-cysteine S-methyltransferase [Baekduiaceae bacterium]
MTDEPLFRAIHETPLGPLTLTATARGLTALHFPGRAPVIDLAEGATPALDAARAELDAYFAGDLRAFTVPLDLAGTAFQRDVWALLRTIPYGETTTYGELAARVGGPSHVRAVAGAIARTPVPIVIPCHRVVGADGALTGYLGGLQRKEALLTLEHAGAPEPAWAFRQTALL